MHYVAIIDGQERAVEIAEVSADHYLLRFDDTEMHVDARTLSDTSVSMIVDGQVYTVQQEANPNGGENLLVRGAQFSVQVLDTRKNRLRKAQESTQKSAGPATVSAPMPGKVVTVLVQEGDSVHEGQGLVVVEAMKMENELKSPKDGVVRDLAAVAGAAVESGLALCVID